MNAQRPAPGILTACSETWQRWLWPLLYLPFAGFGVVVVLAGGDTPTKIAQIAIAVLAIATGVLWFGWFSRILLLRLDAGAALLPGLASAIARAMAGAFAVTVLLPASVLALAGIEPALAFGALTAAAMAGLLVAWLPSMAVAALGLLPLLFSVLHEFVPQLAMLRQSVSALPEFPARWLLLGCGLALLAWWRWHVLARASTQGRKSSRWLRPVVLVPPIGRHRDEDGRLRTATPWQVSAWLYPRRIVADIGPDTPVRAMRIWLGAPFAPVAARYWLFHAGLVAFVALIFLTIGLTATLWQMIVGAAFVGGIGLIGWSAEPIVRLDQLQRSTSGEIAELALLPGLGASASVRARLLRVAFGARAWVLLLVLLALYAALAVQGAGPSRYLLGTLIVAGSAAMGAWLLLRSLVGRPLPKPGSILLLLLGLGLLLPGMLTLFYPPVVTPQPWLFAAWLVVLAVAGVGLLRSWRRFRERAHPFVQA